MQSLPHCGFCCGHLDIQVGLPGSLAAFPDTPCSKPLVLQEAIREKLVGFGCGVGTHVSPVSCSSESVPVMPESSIESSG